MYRSTYILIAEDDEDDQFLLSTAFKEVEPNIELVFVSNGLDLLNHFNTLENEGLRNLPSLLIVDLNMPKKNGTEAIKELCERGYFRNFPTIIFSTTGNELEKHKCKELGIKDFLVKPSSYNELLKHVQKFKELIYLGSLKS